MYKSVASLDAYNTFRVSLYDPHYPNPQQLSGSGSGSNTPIGSPVQSIICGLPNISSPYPKSLAAEFKKSIKRDKSHYEK